MTNDELMTKICAVLRDRRVELGLSQPELADKLKLLDRTMSVYRMEKEGLGIRTVWRLSRVCKALNISTLEVLRRAGVE